MERAGGGAPPRSGRSLVLFLLALLHLALELLHDVRVAERRDVAELLALGDVAQQAAHDLARARLGQVVGPDDALGPREFADPLGNLLADVVAGVAVGRPRFPIRLAPCSRMSLTRASSPSRSPSSVTNAATDWPVSSSLWPMHAASATSECETIADSISAVDMRWPETLMTSSMRPMIQK